MSNPPKLEIPGRDVIIAIRALPTYKECVDYAFRVSEESIRAAAVLLGMESDRHLPTLRMAVAARVIVVQSHE